MKIRLPRPSIVIASVALFVALSGGALAAGIVPLARHAYTADTATNAKKLGGKTPLQLAASFRGARGPQGLVGPAGAAGPAGPAGPAGAAGPKGATGSQGATGDRGPQGPVGSGLHIVGTVATVGDLPVSGSTGDAYLVGGDLYVWTGAAWTNAGPVQGPKGDKGDKGDTGTQGIQGIQGIQGTPGTPGTAAVSVHTQAYSLAANASALETVNCTAGQKAVSGGFDSDGNVFNYDTFPSVADDGWSIFLFNPDSGTDTGTVYAVCLG
jgi:hypothetical protein